MLIAIGLSLIVGLVIGMVIYWKVWGSGADEEPKKYKKSKNSQEDVFVEYKQEDVTMPQGLPTDHRSCGVGDVIKGAIPWRETYSCEPNSVEQNAYYGGGRPGCYDPTDKFVVAPYVVSGTTDFTTYHKLL